MSILFLSPLHTVPEGHFQNENLIVVLACLDLFYGCLLPRLSLGSRVSTLWVVYRNTHLPPKAPHHAASNILSVHFYLPFLSSPLGKLLLVLGISSEATNSVF